MPGQPTTRRNISEGRLRRTDRYDLRAAEITETGGLVVEAKWSDAELYRQPRTGVAGVVLQRNGRPVSGAVVSLAGTADTTRTDALGVFAMDVLPGKYTLVATDTTLTAFVAPRAQSVPVSVSLGALTTTRLELQSLERVLADVCHGATIPDGSAIITGVVALARGDIMPSAEVEATWQADFSNSRAGLQIEARSQVSSIDDQGRFVVCGVPRERPIRLRLRQEKRVVGDTAVRINDLASTLRVVWLVSPATTSSPPPDWIGLAGIEARALPILVGTEIRPSRRSTPMAERSKPHNGRDLDGSFRVREADVDDLLESPEGPDIIRDDVRLGGAVIDTGPQAGQHAREIGEMIAENREDVGKATGKLRDDAKKNRSRS